MIDEKLQPFFEQAGRYHELSMPAEEATYCMGVILGLYRYEHESKSEFRQWAADIPVECAGYMLREWRKRGQDSASTTTAMDEFIRDHCPNSGRYFLRTGGRS